jgi:DNA-binding NarL/FixJ family response regulator
MAAFRTLVVEDHDDLRALLRSLLENETQCVVIGEAVDGLQAVQRAQELQPDMVQARTEWLSPQDGGTRKAFPLGVTQIVFSL